eukprot:180527-Karenia_brevis.AAC.1
MGPRSMVHVPHAWHASNTESTSESRLAYLPPALRSGDLLLSKPWPPVSVSTSLAIGFVG